GGLGAWVAGVAEHRGSTVVAVGDAHPGGAGGAVGAAVVGATALPDAAARRDADAVLAGHSGGRARVVATRLADAPETLADRFVAAKQRERREPPGAHAPILPRCDAVLAQEARQVDAVEVA